MNFSSPQKVVDTIRASDEVEQIRQENRVKINQAINGTPPLSADQAKRMGVKLNVNWGEMAVMMAHGRRQLDMAFLGNQNYFRVRLPMAPEESKSSWGLFITNSINRKMKRSEEYACMKEYQHAAIIAHGVAPTIWEDPEKWRRRFVALEDFRVPTDTETSFENLPWLAVRVLYTEGELAKKVFGEHSDQNWNKPIISKILKEYHNTNYERTNYDWINAPEKMAELVKQNAGFYSSDAVPTIPLWHFYFMDDTKPTRPAIRLRVVPDLGVRGVYETQEFLYDAKNKAHCRRWSQLVSVQYGDMNSKPPFMYQSVRSLGFLMMEPCFWMNLFRCRLLQHGMENFNIWLRIADPEGRARAQKVDLFDKGIVPEGVSIVPQAERHQIDPDLIAGVMAQLKQLQAEGSQSYTQQLDTGTQKEQTAFETRAKLATVNAMMSGVLSRAFRKETYAYEETCRRFCLRNSSDPDVQEFQEECEREGIPKMWLNAELWDIEPEVPVGSGNPTMAQAEVSALMEARASFDPTAQQEILHEFTEVITGDPRKAERWVPLDKRRGVTDAQRDAEFAFATLMQGVPVRMKEGLNVIEQIETLLGLFAGVISQMEKNGNVADAREIIGLKTVGAYVSSLIQSLAQDRQQKARVKQYADTFGKLMNAVKGFEQRLAQNNGNGGVDPAVAGKIAADTIKARSDAKIREATAQQKMHHKELQFNAEQSRRNTETLAEIGREAEKRRFAAFGGTEE